MREAKGAPLQAFAQSYALGGNRCCETVPKGYFEDHLLSPTQARIRIETKAEAMISSAFPIAEENCASLTIVMCSLRAEDELA